MSEDVNPVTGRTCPFVEGEATRATPALTAVRVAVAGKGGAGKTTIAGTLARTLARTGRTVLAVDADTNPNLSVTLGVPPDRATAITSLPRTLIERRPQPDGTTRPVFVADPAEVVRQYGAEAPDGVRLLVMGAVGHGGAG